MEQLDSATLSPMIDRMGGAMALASSARKHKAFLRPRALTSAADLVRLAFMYGPGGYSLRELAAMAAADGVADMSDVAVLQRLKRSADWLQVLCEEALGRAAKAIGADGGGRPIRIVDGSRLQGPGERVWRLHLCYDAARARIVDAAITTTAQGERLDRLVVTAGEIRVGDRGLAHPERIKKPPAAAVKARAKARRASQKNQNRIDARTLVSADYVMLLTSLGCEQFPVDQLGALYRLRWQIELAIKRLKSILHIDRLPAKNPDLARAWLYAHLVFALLLEETAAELDALSPSAPNRETALRLAHDKAPRRRYAREHLATAKT